MGVGQGGRETSNPASSPTSCQVMTPGPSPLSWHRNKVPTLAILGLLRPQKSQQKLPSHVGRSGGRGISYIVLLKLPVLLLGQDLVHHCHGLLSLMDVLPFLAREERQEGISLGPLFMASSFSTYSTYMESGLVSSARGVPRGHGRDCSSLGPRYEAAWWARPTVGQTLRCTLTGLQAA